MKFEDIRAINLKKYDSNKESITLDDAIDSNKSNKLALNTSSSKINFNNEFYIDDTNGIYQYKEYLRNYTITIEDLPEIYFYKPEMLADYVYGSSDLWYLCLWWNDEVPSAMEFNRKEITIYNPERMDLINKFVTYSNKNKEISFVEDLIIQEVKVKDKNL